MPSSLQEKRPPTKGRGRGRALLAAGIAVVLIGGGIWGVKSGVLRRGQQAGSSGTAGHGDPPTPSPDLVSQAFDSPKLSMGKRWTEQARSLREKPNLVFITLESVGANRVGFLGYPREVTPHLDRLAESSIVFERAYTTATHSNYAQMAILSSLFPRRGTTLDMYGRLDYPRFLMHDVAHQLGYTSATISSQDESWQGMLRFQTTDAPVKVIHSPDYTGRRLSLVSEEIVPDEETARLAVGFIDENQGSPFSLYVNLQSTHFPYPIPDGAERAFEPTEPKGRFDFLHWDPADRVAIDNRHDNALRYVDAQVGKIVDALDDRDLLSRTILVVVADHGEMFFDHDLVTHGRSLFEEETRVPLLIRTPDGESAHVTRPVSTLDILPTVIERMGLPPHPAHQGESVWPSRSLDPLANADHPAIFMNAQGWKHLDGVVCLPFKLIADPEEGTMALYDLDRDPRETNDVARTRREVAKALKSVLDSQIEAQQRYHAFTDEGADFRADRYAPNLLPCPPIVHSIPSRGGP